MTTPLKSLEEILVNQANKYLTHNEANRILEVDRVISRTTSAAPGSPNDGDAYIMPAGTLTGDWSGYSEHDWVLYRGTEWVKITPYEGMGPYWVNDSDEQVTFDGSSWVALPESHTHTSIANGTSDVDIPSADGDIVVTRGGSTHTTFASSGQITATGDIHAPGISFDSGGNVLDYYEEDNWTPVIADAASGGNTATGTFEGFYTRVGRVVHIYAFLLNIDTTGMTAGNPIFVRGLPFTTGSTNAGRSVGSVTCDNIAFTGYVTAQTPTSATYFNLFDNASSAGDASLLVSAITSSGTSDLFVSLTYYV